MDEVDTQSVSKRLSELKLEIENLATQLENVCERLDAQHQTISSALLIITSRTGTQLPPSFTGFDVPDDDVLYERVREAVIEAGKVSTSYLQRRFGIGYSRAAFLIDLLEERGVIGPHNGAKPRVVLNATSR